MGFRRTVLFGSCSESGVPKAARNKRKKFAWKKCTGKCGFRKVTKYIVFSWASDSQWNVWMQCQHCMRSEIFFSWQHVVVGAPVMWGVNAFVMDVRLVDHDLPPIGRKTNCIHFMDAPLLY